jgi:hypothetical protein
MHWYGLSYQDILKLPIRTTFVFYYEGLRMEAGSYRELLDISAVPMQPLKYYEFLRAKYNAVIEPKIKELPSTPSLPKHSDTFNDTDILTNQNVGLSGEEMKDHLFSIFYNLKRSQGYG